MTKSVKVKYQCSEYREELQTVFGIDTCLDSSNVHPQHFCHACKNVLHRASKAGYQHKTDVFLAWDEHIEGNCSVCVHYDTVRKGGRPKKVCRTPGRPPNNSPRYCAENIQAIAPPSFVLAHHTHPRICEEHQTIDLNELCCPICCEVLNSPVELIDCQATVCADCCCSWLQHCQVTSCPCCYSDHLQDFSTVRPASQLVLSLLGSLCVICGECMGHVRLETYSQHVEAGCTVNSNTPSQDTTVEDILSQSLTTPLTPVELRLQSKLAKRSLATSPDDNILRIKTGGQVCHYPNVHHKCTLNYNTCIYTMFM